MMFRRSLIALGVLGAAVAVQPAFAQSPPAREHIRGTIASVNGQTMVVHTLSGSDATVMLTDTTKVVAASRASESAIRKGDFIGTAATGPDNDLVAREVVIFPPSMRGTGEGHYPWDLGQQSTMTNATITAEVKEKGARSLTLAYKGGQSVVKVPPNIPVVKFAPGSKSELKPGAKVFVVASSQNGTTDALFVIVGKHGVRPPM